MADGSQDAGSQDAGTQGTSGAGDGDRAGQQQTPPAQQGLTQEQVNAIVTDRLTRDRQARLRDPEFRSQALEAWRDDEDFRSQAVDALGIKPGGKPSGEEMQAAFKQWEQQHVAPLKTRLETAEGRVERLTRKDLHGQIVQHAAALGVKAAFLKPPVPGAPPPVVHILESAFGHDPQTDGWYVKAGDGFAYSTNPTQDRPYKGVDEFLREWAQTDEAKELLEPRSRNGADYRGSSGGARTVSLADFEKMGDVDRAKLFRENPELYRELMQARTQEGYSKLSKR